MNPPASSSCSSSTSIITRKPRLFSHHLFIFLIFILFAIYHYTQNITYIAGQNYPNINQNPPSPSTAGNLFFSNSPENDVTKLETVTNGELEEDDYKKLPFSIGKTEDGCDVFSGKWVWDPVSRPMYQEPECPYIQPQLTCQAHGRPDRDYQFWRWQPHGCSIPRYKLLPDC